MKKRDIICPHCRALNPPTAYVCIKCFKVIYEKYKVPFWKMNISSVAGTLVFSIAIFLSLIYLLNKWLESVEAEMTVKVQTAQYNVSVAAEKARRKVQFGVTSDTETVKEQQPSTTK
jgi:DNA-directed RNA polymerase subunit RPC12/RpoP